MSDQTGDNESVKTHRLMIEPDNLETADANVALGEAAEILLHGGLVALPTETVYGLGANALDPVAVGRIFAAKGRPAWDPIIVHVSSRKMLEILVHVAPEFTSRVEKLMDAFWPGPLTLLLLRTAKISDAVTAGRPLVGVRMPAHPVALKLIGRAGVPVAAPSANLFGHTSPTNADHVLEDLDGRIDAVLDAGATEHGVESTVLDPCLNPMLIYRQGAITAKQIRAVAGPVVVFEGVGESRSATPESLPSPGLGLRHYAPRARLILVDLPVAELGDGLREFARSFSADRVGIMLPEGIEAAIPDAAIFRWGRWSEAESMAHHLYEGLRALDAQGCAVILCPLPPDGGIGSAMRDRLQKAACASKS